MLVEPDTVDAAGGFVPIDPDTAGGSCHVSDDTMYHSPPFLMTSTVSPRRMFFAVECSRAAVAAPSICTRSEEHTSELQSRGHLVCRLLLEKKNNASNYITR